MSGPNRFTRRDFLRATSLLASGAVAAACAPAPAPPAPAAATTAPEAVEPTAAAEPTAAPAAAAGAGSPNESPMLAELVNAGKLPALSERLPQDPKITNEMPSSQLTYVNGKFGGTLRHSCVTGREADVFVMCNEPLVNTPGLLGEEMTGNVLKGFEVSGNQQEITFFMRKGMKWSDGEPVTSENVRYAWEDVTMNEELTPSWPAWLRSGGSPTGEPMTLEIIDDYTFKMTSAEPYGGFLISMALEGWRDYSGLLKPSHWMKQFHTKYASEEELNALIAEDGQVENWVQLHQKNDRGGGTAINDELSMGMPKLHPWILVNATQEQHTYERNPYYFKVDQAGNQLPYIDKIVSTFVQDAEALNLKLVSGETDFAREALALNNMPLYRDNEKNGYKTGIYNMHITPTDVFLNWTYNDPTWRQVVADLRFRQALNYAIDRAEVIDSVYYGYAEPQKYWNPEYSPDKANALLDEIGMDKKGDDGFRLGPDGKPFSIDFVVSNQLWADLVPVTELFVQFWKAIGINTTMKGVDTGLWWTTSSANEAKATVVNTQTPMWTMIPKLDWWAHWAPPWVTWWYSGGAQGEEPPDDIKGFMEKLFSIMQVPVSEAPQVADEVMKWMGENLLYFVHIQNVKQPLIYNAKFGNIDDKQDALAIAYNFAAEQFFFNE